MLEDDGVLHPPRTEDPDDQIGKGSENSAGVADVGIDGMKKNLTSCDDGSSDNLAAVSMMPALDDGAGVAETGLIDSDKFHAALSRDSDQLDTSESAKFARADGGKLDAVQSADFDEALITSSEYLVVAESDGRSEARIKAGTIDTVSSSETFPVSADIPNTIDSVECVDKDRMSLPEKWWPADKLESRGETADDVASKDATAAGLNPDEYTLCTTLNSLVSQLKSAVGSALSGSVLFSFADHSSWLPIIVT